DGVGGGVCRSPFVAPRPTANSRPFLYRLFRASNSIDRCRHLWARDCKLWGWEKRGNWSSLVCAVLSTPPGVCRFWEAEGGKAKSGDAAANPHPPVVWRGPRTDGLACSGTATLVFHVQLLAFACLQRSGI
ncbi:unnamed protein product, partial [Scytosiphon promiscuus]